MESYEEGRILRGKFAPTESEQPRNPVLQSRKPRNTSMSMLCGSGEDGKRVRSKLEGLKQHEMETQVAITDIAGQKKRKVIKSENQERKDEMSAMKREVQRNENLRDEGEQRIKTELPEVETNGTGITNTVVSPETLKKMGACDEVNNTTFLPEEERADDDILSALSGPPKVPNTSGLATELLQAYTLSIPTVKNGLISFLTTAKPEDAALMITQANNALTSLYALNADFGSFYNKVRSYIHHCSELSTAQKELEENKEAVKLVSCYEEISIQSTAAARAVSDIKAKLETAREYLTPLEATFQETKVLLNKLEAEVGRRRTEVADLEAEKIQLEEVFAEFDVKQQAIAAQAKKAKEALKFILRRREAARAAVEETRALLSSS